MRSIFFVLVLCVFLCAFVYGGTRISSKKPVKTTPKKPAVLYNDTLLPKLTDLLEELNLSTHLHDFVKLGVSETRSLLRLSDMDFRILAFDHGVSDDQIAVLKKRIKELIEIATVVEKPVRTDLEIRRKLKYGRIYMARSAQTFEYLQASFGGPPPLGSHLISLADSPDDGCYISPLSSLEGYVLVVRRGNCSYLQKAKNAKEAKAAALIIVNSEEKVESLASGYGIDPKVRESEVIALGDFPVLSVANSTWARMEYSQRLLRPNSATIDIVPLKCLSSGTCVAVTPEELSLVPEVSWGRIMVGPKDQHNERVSMEFLVSSYGGVLPRRSELTKLIFADPIDGCLPLLNPFEDTDNALVVIERGNCKFDMKTLHGQAAGARMVMIVDHQDNPLQRIGSQPPLSSHIGIPALLVGKMAKEYFENHRGQELDFDIEYGQGNQIVQNWLDLAITEWKPAEEDRKTQLKEMIRKYSSTNHIEVVMWLQRRLQDLQNDVKDEL